MKPYFARYGRRLNGLLLCMICGSTMGVVMTYLSSRQLIAISQTSLEGMVIYTLLTLAAVSIHHTAWFLWDKMYAVIGGCIARDMRKDVAASMMNLKLDALQEHSFGYYLERLNEDADEVSRFVMNVMGTLVDLVTNVTFLIIIYFQSWQCGLVFTIGIAGLYMIDLVKIRVELAHTKKEKHLKEMLNSKTTEALRGVKDVKMLGLKEEILSRIDRVSGQLTDEQAKKKRDVVFLERVRTYSQWMLDAALVLISAFWLLPAGKITVVILLIVFNYKGLMYETIGYFSQLKGYYVQGDFKAGRMLEIIDSAQKEEYGDVKLTDAHGEVTVRGLSFSYGDKEILHEVSFVLKPCEATLLLGASGSGKSTLHGLMTKLLDVPEQSIYIDGHDIASLNEASLNSLISVVSQEPFLFEDSIAGNLRMVCPQASDEQIECACRRAHIYDEIMDMPQGFETILTENGGNLSGGQKQRLAIARAILKNTPVILFDEPSSALDAKNQMLLLRTIKELKRDKTVFVIAHKIEQHEVFDQILEMRARQIWKREQTT